MNPETANLKQKAVYWAVTRYDGQGEPVLADPVEINARYEISLSSARNPVAKPIQAYTTVIVDRETPVDGRLYLGTLASVPASYDTMTAYKIISYTGIPDIKCRHTLHRVTVG